jgi:CDP-glucose 4,6-dehydratase
MVNLPPIGGYRGRRVLVTGDTGFKGSWLALWLSELGAEVTGLALPPERGDDHFPMLALDRVIRHVDGDIRDREALYRVFGEAQPEIVFHLAAQSLVRRSYAEPIGTFETNVLGSVNVLEAVRCTPSVISLVYVTSDKCYRNREWVWGYRESDELGGRDPYSASKAAAELVFSSYRDSFLAAREKLGAASARAGNVIGGGDWAPDRLVPDCIRSLQLGQPIRLRNPASTRPWQHVLEPLHGYLLLGLRLIEDPRRFSGPWNFGPDDSAAQSVEEVARRIVALWGSGSIVREAEAAAPHEAGRLHLNVDKARLQLGWKPKWTFERAVAEAVAWYSAVNQGVPAADASRHQLQTYMEQL